MDDSDRKKKIKIGRRFRVFRELMNWDRGELAKEVGVSRAVIEEIETGKIMPLIQVINILYVNHGLNLNWLISGKENMILLKSVQKGDLDQFLQIPVIEAAVYDELKKIKTKYKGLIVEAAKKISCVEIKRSDPVPDTRSPGIKRGVK